MVRTHPRTHHRDYNHNPLRRPSDKEASQVPERAGNRHSLLAQLRDSREERAVQDLRTLQRAAKRARRVLAIHPRIVQQRALHLRNVVVRVDERGVYECEPRVRRRARRREGRAHEGGRRRGIGRRARVERANVERGPPARDPPRQRGEEVLAQEEHARGGGEVRGERGEEQARRHNVHPAQARVSDCTWAN